LFKSSNSLSEMQFRRRKATWCTESLDLTRFYPRDFDVKLYQIQKPFLYFGATKNVYNKDSDENGHIYLGLWV
jgi:hypothetical protein